MPRARASRLPLTILAGLLLPALLAGCGCDGRGKPAAQDGALTFEQLADTSGLSSGPPIVEAFDVYRMTGGSLRVRARVRLPDGTKVQVAIRDSSGGSSLAMTQALVDGGLLESPPMMAPSGPLPVAAYRFELTAQFTPQWQSAAVLRATDDGKSLRGAGITRTHVGGAMFQMVEEMTR